MSLKNITPDNYSYEMLKTQYHELFITTRTFIQDPSIRPSGARRVSWRNFRLKKRKGKGKTQRGSGGKANMANKNHDPYNQAYWGKGKGKKGKKGKSRYSYDGTKGYPSYENGKGKGGHDKRKSKTFAATGEKTEEQPAIQQTAPSTNPTYAGFSHMAGTHPMRHPAQDKG